MPRDSGYSGSVRVDRYASAHHGYAPGYYEGVDDNQYAYGYAAGSRDAKYPPASYEDGIAGEFESQDVGFERNRSMDEPGRVDAKARPVPSGARKSSNRREAHHRHSRYEDLEERFETSAAPRDTLADSALGLSLDDGVSQAEPKSSYSTSRWVASSDYGSPAAEYLAPYKMASSLASVPSVKMPFRGKEEIDDLDALFDKAEYEVSREEKVPRWAHPRYTLLSKAAGVIRESERINKNAAETLLKPTKVTKPKKAEPIRIKHGCWVCPQCSKEKKNSDEVKKHQRKNNHYRSIQNDTGD